MKTIYISHSKDFDFKQELYNPLRNSVLNLQYNFVLPHETNEFINSKEIIKNSNLVIAEVSYPSTGVGIELGWTDSFLIPIICLHKENSKPSKSLNAITKTIISYNNSTDMTDKVEKSIQLIFNYD